MKKILFVLLIIVIFTLFLPVQRPAYAQNKEDKLDGQIDKTLDKLDYKDLESFFNEINEAAVFGNNFKQLLKDLLSGKSALGADKISLLVLAYIRNAFLGMLPLVITLLAVGLLYGLGSNLSSGFLKKSTTDIIYYVCLGAIVIVLITSVNGIIADFRRTIDLLSKFNDIVFPILLTLVTALGGVSAAGVYQPAIAAIGAIIIKIVTATVMPLFLACIVFCIIGSLSNNIKLDKLTNTTKSTAEWILGIMFSLFIAFISVEGIAGSAFDSVTIRSAKFALSGYLPIIGGQISDGFDLVVASLILLKNSFGLISIIILLSIVLAPAIKIILFSLLLKATAAVLEPVADKRVSDLLFNTAKCFNLLLVIIIGLAFIIFIMLMLIIVTCNLGMV
ncbi:MAG: stage III sporulation protein AE [Christensenellales bacterium]